MDEGEHPLGRQSELDSLSFKSFYSVNDEKAHLSVLMLQHSHNSHAKVSEQELPSSTDASIYSHMSSASGEDSDLHDDTIKGVESRFFGLLSKLWGSKSECSREKTITKTRSKTLCDQKNLRKTLSKGQHSPTESGLSSFPRAFRMLDRRHQMKPMDIAGQNCQKAHIIISTLYNVAERLENDKSLGGCNWTVKNRQSESKCLEQYLKNTSENPSARFARDSPQSLHQMMRLALWTRAEIEDEIRGLVLAKGMEGDDLKEKKRKFTCKWASTPEQAFPGVPFECKWSKISKHTQVEAFLSGSLADSCYPWAMAISFWSMLHATFQESSTTYSLCDRRRYYDFDHGTIRAILEEMTPGFPLQKQVGERCARNVEAVQTILSSFQEEIIDEIDRRKACKHAHPHRFHHSRRRALEKALTILRMMSSTISELAMDITQMRLKPFRSNPTQWKTLMDWGSLDGSSYREMVGLTSDELVERLVEQPIPENEVAETDELFKYIETGELQARTHTIFLTRQEEKRRAAEQAEEKFRKSYERIGIVTREGR